MRGYKNIIITVPHAYCYRALTRVCDRNAENLARSLENYFVSHGVPTAVFINHEVRRSDMDMNRDESLNTQFRMSITKRIRELTGTNNGGVFLFDAHSFPSYDTDFGKYDFIILDMSRYFPEFSWLLSVENKMLENIRRVGYRTKLKQGSKENSIVFHAMELGAPGILLECNEDLTREDLNNIVTAMFSGV